MSQICNAYKQSNMTSQLMLLWDGIFTLLDFSNFNVIHLNNNLI